MPETETTPEATPGGPESRGFQLDTGRAFEALKIDSGNRIAELLGDLAVKNTIITQLAEENQKIAEQAQTLIEQNQNLRDAVEGLEARLNAQERPRPQVVKMAVDPAATDPAAEVAEADGA